MSHTLLLQCPHTYHHMPSSIIPRANHQQIKQHHNHQSTTHPPHHHRHHPSSTIHQQQPPFSPGQQQLPTGEQHRASPRFSKRSPHTSKKSPSVAKRICRFSAAAPSAQCIESPRSHLILDNKPHTRTKSRGLQTTPRQFTQEVGGGRSRRITRRSFPTNRPTSRTRLARPSTKENRPHNPHDTSTAAPSAENKEFPRKTPPMLHTPTPTEDRLPLTQSASSAVHSPANIQPKALPSRLRSIK